MLVADTGQLIMQVSKVSWFWGFFKESTYTTFKPFKLLISTFFGLEVSMDG